jgi:4,5:9,10-diseco-3-hydroxy-5,9,17-trioxoandrosta-1(10),2-diene-4-oate hydrolase
MVAAAEPFNYIQANGPPIAIKRWGAGPTVLCLHAIGHESGDFSGFADRLAERFEVIALDWPGQGHSPPDGHPPTASHYAEIVLNLCTALRLERPILVGNSIGGAAALTAVYRAPDRFAGLVLCNSGGLAPIDPLVRFVIARMVAFFEAGTRGAFWFNPAFKAYYRYLVLPRPPAQAQRDRIIASGQDIAPILAQAWRGFADPSADLRALVPDITIPVWLAWASSDRILAWSRSKPAAMQFPNVSVSFFQGGHAAFLEDPDRFAKAFIEFATTIVCGHKQTDNMKEESRQ